MLQSPYKPESFSGLIFTIAQVVFITTKITFILKSLSAVQTCDFHIFIVVYSQFHGFIWNQYNDQLTIGLLAQLIERCIGIAEFMGSNPYRLESFSGLSFTTAAVFITAKIPFIFTSLSAVQKCDFHTFIIV